MNNLRIQGTGNIVNGLDPNCLIDNISIQGISNSVNLNQNCYNANKNISGLQNRLQFNGVDYNEGNNMNNNARNNANVNQRFIRIDNNNNNQNNQNSNVNYFNFSNNVNVNDLNDINSFVNQFSDFGININLNNRNVSNNVNNFNNNQEEENINENNLSDFDKKKQDLFLEMDEYQYKHIQKYESRKETECAICLEEFKGIDIIKAFYKCEHIFHKTCLKNWLKRSNVCPLCNHDLKDDINQMH